FMIERFELGFAGLVADQQQERDFFKCGVGGKVGDLIAAINELRLVDRADLRIANGLAGETTGIGSFGGGGGSSSGCRHGMQSEQWLREANRLQDNEMF